MTRLQLQHAEFKQLLDELEHSLSMRRIEMSDVRAAHLKLVGFATNHFAEEEREMETINYPIPALTEHQTSHFEFMRRLGGLLSDAEASQDPTNRTLDTVLFLNSWIRKHGPEHDQPLIDALQGGVPEPG